jgi:2',3'-cyclic-nucleotide 2'-phosphodiesterase (5'-nucleotidase family)
MIRIYHTSDLHDRRHIAGPLRRLRAERPGLLVDCGDSLRGSQTVYFRREPIVDELDAAGYDVTAMGNREFHYLFGAVGARLRKMHHPVVCANLVDTRGRALPFAADAQLRAGDGAAVRFFGLLVPQYPSGSPWERLFGWRFLDPVAVAAEIARTTPPGVTLIALSHLGLRADRELARGVARLELILGGHSHDTLTEPEVVNGVPIVHAGPYGAFASRTELVRDGDRARIADFALVSLA